MTFRTFTEHLQDEHVRLVAVSKTRSVEEILSVYEQGHLDFGENRVQELQAKQALLPTDIRWHLIGHLQRNKVKYIAPFVWLIHAVDSAALLEEINKQGLKNDRRIRVLLQFKIAAEDSKYGLDLEGARALLDEGMHELPSVDICGVMGMATFTDDRTRIREEFRGLKAHFDELKADYFSDRPAFKEVSMGMSNDYDIALEEGATMVRIGSLIFGPRS